MNIAAVFIAYFGIKETQFHPDSCAWRECIFDLGNIIAWRRFEVGQFRHHHSGKTRTMALFWLRTSYHAHRYMFQRYMLRSLLKQSFKVVNTPVILLFSKKWVPGFAAEDNSRHAFY